MEFRARLFRIGLAVADVREDAAVEAGKGDADEVEDAGSDAHALVAAVVAVAETTMEVLEEHGELVTGTSCWR